MMLSLYSAMTFPHTTLSLALTAFFVLIISFQSEIGESIAVAYIFPPHNKIGLLYRTVIY
jgi:hypothetical protein